MEKTHVTDKRSSLPTVMNQAGSVELNHGPPSASPCLAQHGWNGISIFHEFSDIFSTSSVSYNPQQDHCQQTRNFDKLYKKHLQNSRPIQRHRPTKHHCASGCPLQICFNLHRLTGRRYMSELCAPHGCRRLVWVQAVAHDNWSIPLKPDSREGAQEDNCHTWPLMRR